MYTDGDKKYAHFDKVSIYNRPLNLRTEKDIFFGVIMNNTDTKRSKKLLKTLKWLNAVGINTDLKGKWNNEYCSGVLTEEEVPEYLKRVKYTVNIAVEPQSTSQKIWEYIMNGVICFYMDYDLQYNIVPKDNWMRVKDEYELAEKIEFLEKNEEKYKGALKYQERLLKDEYIDGSFILKEYNKLMNEVLKGGEGNV
jgi:hypothetical protein